MQKEKDGKRPRTPKDTENKSSLSGYTTMTVKHQTDSWGCNRLHTHIMVYNNNNHESTCAHTFLLQYIHKKLKIIIDSSQVFFFFTQVSNSIKDVSKNKIIELKNLCINSYYNQFQKVLRILRVLGSVEDKASVKVLWYDFKEELRDILQRAIIHRGLPCIFWLQKTQYYYLNKGRGAK